MISKPLPSMFLQGDWIWGNKNSVNLKHKPTCKSQYDNGKESWVKPIAVGSVVLK